MKQKFGKCGFIKPVGQQSKHLPFSLYNRHQHGLELETIEISSLLVVFFSCTGLSAAVLVGDGLQVDKDVKLMRDYFGLEDDYADMSPMVLPSGYTKDFIDGKIKASRGVSHWCQTTHTHL
jgi:hypothetical protein